MCKSLQLEMSLELDFLKKIRKNLENLKLCMKLLYFTRESFQFFSHILLHTHWKILADFILELK